MCSTRAYRRSRIDTAIEQLQATWNLKGASCDDLDWGPCTNRGGGPQAVEALPQGIFRLSTHGRISPNSRAVRRRERCTQRPIPRGKGERCAVIIVD